MGSTISYQPASPDHEHYRTMARKSAMMRHECSQQSQVAYLSGNGARAKELSLKSKEHGLEMDRYNNMARDIVFRVNNSSRPSNELDLHGLKVREALDITRERLNRFIKNKEPNLIIIVGRGKNSLNGVAKIKPAVIELVTQFRIKATPNKPNQGCVYIEPLPGNEGYDFSWIDGFFKGFLQKLSALFFGSSK
ncbi:hypothetical protein BC939DRAFT_438499 [Gamsiella multidivaricata]|uniref:uncharacterized protein n=1 Tax=Gamsiella multidivaricata TaxID=101098 RepID=UPI0022206FDB|nr:uncharacterized protein BC939DRAFT_438499 [Gamsiella multidivaricata]KAI7830604.1 hypothetical protein BC939DRAFT_438499 [Gamsiella multidivaricata]